MSRNPKLAIDEDKNIQDYHLRDSAMLQLEWEPEINEKEISVAAGGGL